MICQSALETVFRVLIAQPQPAAWSNSTTSRRYHVIHALLSTRAALAPLPDLPPRLVDLPRVLQRSCAGPASPSPFRLRKSPRAPSTRGRFPGLRQNFPSRMPDVPALSSG